MILKRAVAVVLIAFGLSVVSILGLGFGPGSRDSKLPIEALPQGTIQNADGTYTLPSGEKVAVTQEGTVVNSETGATVDATAQTGEQTSTSMSSSGSTSSSNNSGSSSSGSSNPSTPGASIQSFTASPGSVTYNSQSTLTWSASNVSACSISPSIGAVGSSGSKSTGNLTSSVTYTLTCGPATAQVSVSVGAAPPSCGQAGGTCTYAQVSSHNSKSDCWVTYNGYYYIVTSYIPNHPGGQSVFTSSVCGHDIGPYLSGSAGSPRHNHGGSAYNILNNYRIGPVQ